jgi:hypothetical protein
MDFICERVELAASVPMGALRPWHVVVLLGCLAVVVAVVVVIVLAVLRASRRR